MNANEFARQKSWDESSRLRCGCGRRGGRALQPGGSLVRSAGVGGGGQGAAPRYQYESRECCGASAARACAGTAKQFGRGAERNYSRASAQTFGANSLRPWRGGSAARELGRCDLTFSARDRRRSGACCGTHDVGDRSPAAGRSQRSAGAISSCGETQSGRC